MKRQLLATAALGLALSVPAFAAKSDRGPVVYGAPVGSSTMLKDYDAAGNKRAAASKQAAAPQAKTPAPAPGESKKKKVAKKSGVN